MLLKYETERLILKILEPDAASEVLSFYLADQELFEKYEAERNKNFYTEEFQRNVLELEYGLAMKLSQVRFYVFRKGYPETIVGTVSLYDISRTYSRAEIGYKFSSVFHYFGYASESVKKVIEIAFNELELHKLNAHVQIENERSIHLLSKLGFMKEGISRDYLCINGKWTDHLRYSIINDEK